MLDRGFVTYSNEAKHESLGVSNDIIDTFGAVSIACTWAMAQGALKRSNADVAVAISGIAGPDGGSLQKPVGTVVFARAIRGEEELLSEERWFDVPDRAGVRLQAALVALELLLPESASARASKAPTILRNARAKYCPARFSNLALRNVN